MTAISLLISPVKVGVVDSQDLCSPPIDPRFIPTLSKCGSKERLPLEHSASGEPEHSLGRLVLPLYENKLLLVRDGVDSNDDAVYSVHDAAVDVFLVELVGEVHVVLQGEGGEGGAT